MYYRSSRGRRPRDDRGKPYLASGDTATVVIIAHGNNFSTLYGHLDDRVHPPIVQSAYVNAGQVIAYEDDRGTTGPHLHFMTIPAAPSTRSRISPDRIRPALTFGQPGLDTGCGRGPRTQAAAQRYARR
jgi:hypothetical protein